MGSSAKDDYNSPSAAPADWWQGVKVESLGIVAGAEEILVDDIRTIAEKMKVIRNRRAMAMGGLIMLMLFALGQ